jgi:8-oxo-dGTP diphosphatase
MIGDGDGWVQCSMGHRHWGRFGAAGLLISTRRRAILQHRAPWTHEGDKWGLPGGARDSDEDPTSTAQREALEEAGLPASSSRPVALSIEDHGGWSYTTVLAGPVGRPRPHAANAESTEIRWWPKSEIAGLDLHHGLAANWTRLRRLIRPLRVVVDTRSAAHFAGWLAEGAQHDDLDSVIRRGIDCGLVTHRPGPRESLRLLPAFDLIGRHGGNDRRGHVADPPAGPRPWWHDNRTFVTISAFADTGAIAALVEHVVRDRLPTSQVIVVSTDRALGSRLPVAARIRPPEWLTELLVS